jgi:NDP-sugar pyrophosphorylase family protein
MKSAGIIAAGWGERLGKKIPKALTQVGGKALIDYTLDGFEAAGIERVTCIVNEAAQAVPEHVARSGRKLEMDWIIRTTPSSMHSFLVVLERLFSLDVGAGLRACPPFRADAEVRPYMITTVDSICPPSAYRNFIADSDLFHDADVSLGLTTFIDDEKPLRVAMRGAANTGLMPARVADDPEAYEIVAMTTNGFDSEYITAGLYRAGPRILKEKERVLSGEFTALRQYLGYLLKYGYRFYGVPLPAVVDVDRPEDILAAERFLEKTKCS